MAVEAECDLAPCDLLALIKRIEAQMGRDMHTERWGPRAIDIDVLFYEDLVIEGAGITIPHPYMQERAFVLEPLAEIAPEKRHPKLDKTVSELLDDLRK